MHILIVTDGIYPFSMGGSHRLVYEASQVLRSSGHRVTCVVPAIGKKSNFYMDGGKLDEDSNFRVVRFPLDDRSLLTKFRSHFSGFLAPVKELLDAGDVDVINVQYLPALFSLRRLFATNLIQYTFYGPWAGEFRLSFSGRLDGRGKLVNLFSRYVIEPIMYFVCFQLEKYLLHRCTRFMVLSKYSKNMLVGMYKISKKSITVVPAGVDSKTFFPEFDSGFRSTIDGGKSSVFLTVRRLEKRMGLDILIRACSILKADYDDFILLIGGKGIQMNYLSNLIIELGLENNVKLLGFVPENDLNKYLSSADLFILPSRDLEGFGLVVLESMACGTPILVSPEGGPPEVVGLFDEQMVLLNLDPLTISEKLKFLVKSNKLNDAYSNKCVKFVSDRYSWNRFSESYVKWLN